MSQQPRDIFDRLVEEWASSISFKLFVAGICVIVLSHVVFQIAIKPTLSTESTFSSLLVQLVEILDFVVKVVGATFIQAGLITFVIDRHNLETLATIRLPRALFDGEYLTRVDTKERERILDKVLNIQLGNRMPEGQLSDARRSLLSSLSTPARRDYSLKVSLLDSDVCAEAIPGSWQVKQTPLSEDVLCIRAEYDYYTERSYGSDAIPINGTGIIHHFNDTVPDLLQLAEVQATGVVSDTQLEDWIRLNIRPALEVQGSQGKYSKEPVIEGIALDKTSSGKLWLRFIVKCDYMVEPDESVRVIYKHNWFVEKSDFYYWTSSATTRNFRFELLNFEEFDLTPIPTPAIVSLRGVQGISEEQRQRLQLGRNQIICDGVIYPNSTYIFAWHKIDP